MTARYSVISRRWLFAALAGAAAWGCSRAVRARLVCRQDWRQVLTALFANPRGAVAIGSACLKALPPHQRSAGALTVAIAEAAGCDRDAIVGGEPLRARLAERVRKEFADGEVLNVEGWLLSPTEARLYALAALSESKAT